MDLNKDTKLLDESYFNILDKLAKKKQTLFFVFILYIVYCYFHFYIFDLLIFWPLTLIHVSNLAREDVNRIDFHSAILHHCISMLL